MLTHLYVRLLITENFYTNKKKKAKEIKAKAAKIVIKDIRFGPHTDDHDFNFKKIMPLSFYKKVVK